MDVNIGKDGGMERITVYENDTARGLAGTFCKKHGLDEEMCGKLTAMLEQ